MAPGRITVVGAGVVGLSCAIRLAEAGHTVRILAERRTPHTTSDVAAAIWFPYLAEPRDRVVAWCRASLARFRAIEQAHGEEAGIAWADAVVVEHEPGLPWWGDLVDALAPIAPAAAPAGLPPAGAPGPDAGGSGGNAWRCRVPVIAMPLYMRHLEAHAARLGVEVATGRLRGLPPGTVVNCSGLGARELARDTSMVPIRGQVARIARRLPAALLVQGMPATYAVPRPDGTVLGGTAQSGDEGLDVRPEDEAAFMARLQAHLGPLGPVVGRAVGLRPGRPQVRLEREERPQGPVVHAYGHGGAGVTLSWGCADEVARLVGPVGAVGPGEGGGPIQAGGAVGPMRRAGPVGPP